MKDRKWLFYSIITTLFWGVWGAFSEMPAKAGFPATLVYCVWALTMIPCSIYALKVINWKLEHDKRSIILGTIVGLTGAGGQLILFQALRLGPAYLIFPLISLYPIITIVLSVAFLKERTTKKSAFAIGLSLIAIFLLSYSPSDSTTVQGSLWLIIAFIVFLAWGVQAFVMKFSNNTMKAESIFFYMTVTAVALIPVAIMMTDFSTPINWGFQGPYLAALVQVLNAIGALTLVYAVRYGKAIIVVPMTSLAPVITIILSLIIYSVFPSTILIAGMVVATIAIYLLAE